MWMKDFVQLQRWESDLGSHCHLRDSSGSRTGHWPNKYLSSRNEKRERLGFILVIGYRKAPRYPPKYIQYLWNEAQVLMRRRTLPESVSMHRSLPAHLHAFHHEAPEGRRAFGRAAVIHARGSHTCSMLSSIPLIKNRTFAFFSCIDISEAEN